MTDLPFPPFLLQDLRLMMGITKRLKEKREERGALSLASNEVRVLAGNFGGSFSSLGRFAAPELVMSVRGP